MNQPKQTFDREFWEQLWSKTLSEHPDKVARRPPNPHLIQEVASIQPGRALDAGCGHGAETLWLAAHGWQVTALDFSSDAMAYGKSMAETAGADIAARIEWIVCDLATWNAAPEQYDLVVCMYVHVADSVEDMVKRMGSYVAPGGTLFMIGHRPVDSKTGNATAANQQQVSLEEAKAALNPNDWEFIVAEERQRKITSTGVDAVIRVRRRK